jgi:hypothetical protein
LLGATSISACDGWLIAANKATTPTFNNILPSVLLQFTHLIGQRLILANTARLALPSAKIRSEKRQRTAKGAASGIREMWPMSVARGNAERHQPWDFGLSCAGCITAPRRRPRYYGRRTIGVPQTAQNASTRFAAAVGSPCMSLRLSKKFEVLCLYRNGDSVGCARNGLTVSAVTNNDVGIYVRLIADPAAMTRTINFSFF